MLGNLRGLRESTKLFGIPVYAFVGVMAALVIAGAYQVMTGTAVPVITTDPLPTLGTGSITLFVLLSAFANGCTAMTGVEAVSDGVPAFKAPSAQNRDADAEPDGGARDCHVHGHQLSRACLPDRAERERNGRVADRARRVRRTEPRLLRRAGRHHVDPGAGREHRVRRLPSPGVDRRARSLHAAAVHEPWRQARLFERHRRAERGGRHALHHLRRRSARADPALHDRRLPVVHAVADRHVPALRGACASRVGRSARRSAAWARS